MALGPKAMGEAIVANLKTKTGKDLAAWRAELKRQGISDQQAAKQWLRDQGLGHFQAVTVTERHFSNDQYADERKLVHSLFERFPEQYALYEAAVRGLSANRCKPQPCRGYVPLYRDGKIVVSFKPTARGLYAALNLTNHAQWPASIAHKPSLGGSTRLKHGVYLSKHAEVKQLLRELEG
jgi:hypothetical protein